TYVMPNGFDPDQLIDFEPLCDPRVPPWLVYFGKEQPYYDWELLYQAASELTEKGVISGLRLFGVDQAPSSYPSVFAHGAFDRESLVRALSDIENPILVVHSSASDAARATSPVKLFEYAALALPIVCSGSMSRQAGRLHGVRFYPAGDQSGLVEAIHELAVDYPLARERAAGSRDVAMAHYTWPAVVGDWHKGAL
ncbi:MAG: hypothetical protein ACPGJX_15550, partial [Alloalcanivorax venustensis]|uniref:hypothetical protein n=1 Tax=Alloalcanivorax venustensis TaxID=172371 RepID=UPI003C3A0C61